MRKESGEKKDEEYNNKRKKKLHFHEKAPLIIPKCACSDSAYKILCKSRLFDLNIFYERLRLLLYIHFYADRIFQARVCMFAYTHACVDTNAGKHTRSYTQTHTHIHIDTEGDVLI